VRGGAVTVVGSGEDDGGEVGVENGGVDGVFVRGISMKMLWELIREKV